MCADGFVGFPGHCPFSRENRSCSCTVKVRVQLSFLRKKDASAECVQKKVPLHHIAAAARLFSTTVAFSFGLYLYTGVCAGIVHKWIHALEVDE